MLETMKRTQIYLEEELDRELRETASSEGRSAAALIREAIRAYLSARQMLPARRDDPILKMIGVLEGGSERSSEDVDEVLYGRSRSRRR